MNEKLQMLEGTLGLSESERKQQQEKIRELQETEKRLKNEKHTLRAQMESSSGELTKNELKLKALDGELQRQKRVQQDAEAENRELRERLSAALKANQELESNVSSLNLAIQKLNSAVSKGEEEETRLKEKVQALSVSLSESNCSSQNLQDHIAQLQQIGRASCRERV